jgi:hypothetical protein
VAVVQEVQMEKGFGLGLLKVPEIRPSDVQAAAT